MLAHRIIPVILHKHGLAVKGRGFAADRVIGNALQLALVHAARGVDELMILEVGDAEPDYAMVERLTTACFSPVAVGGNIRTIEHIRLLLAAGADKVVIGNVRERNDFIGVAAERFGRQAIVQSVDVDPVSVYYVSEWAGEILLQSRSLDGTMQGYDVGLIRAVSKSFGVPVIASGGCSGPEDMLAAIQAGASAVAAGALFCFCDTTPLDCARYLHDHGVEVRLR